MSVVHRAVRVVERMLSTLFWVLLLLGFNAPPLAMMTVLCAVMHEGGHLVALWWTGHSARAPLHRPNGFLLPTDRPLSYREELLVAGAGPLCNLAMGIVFLLLRPLGKAFFSSLGCVSLLTGVCNLLPLGGYDGERLLRTAIRLHRGDDCADTWLRRLSLLSSSVLTLLSLYLVWRADTGYWLLGVFLVSLVSQVSGELKRDAHLSSLFWRKQEKTRENKRKSKKNDIFSMPNRG